jgi:tetratricopeptide (TPR) repeat protein
LQIESEWIRLTEIFCELPFDIELERSQPPTLERLGLLLAGKQQRVVHFMGHGAQDPQTGAVVCFEQENGSLDAVTARDFLRTVHQSVFLVTLNACVSAAAGETHLSNLAAALVQQHTPYALGMRFPVLDQDALLLSQALYGYLARGCSVEEATYQARLALARGQHRWTIGVPVLYTSLAAPAPGFAISPGTPTITATALPPSLYALPAAEGGFQGRIDELQQLGTALTGPRRTPLLTIHGGGGQGKTALAREAIARFAHAWPGGVWALSFHSLPTLDLVLTDLARFLHLDLQEHATTGENMREVQARLEERRTLLVLDNLETLLEALTHNQPEAQALVQFFQQLPGLRISLLTTSRIQPGWAGEVMLELHGLLPAEGAALLRLSAPQRCEKIDRPQGWQLSQKVDGNPLSLRLLGSAFNASALSFSTFIEQYEEHLLQTENHAFAPDHRQRSLVASIETSLSLLSSAQRRLLGKLQVFHAPFSTEMVAHLLPPMSESGLLTATTDETDAQLALADQLHILWQHGLLRQETTAFREGTLQLYHLSPAIRPSLTAILTTKEQDEDLRLQFGRVCSWLLTWLDQELDRGGPAAFLVLQLHEDLERGAECVDASEQGFYAFLWGKILRRIGEHRRALQFTEQALEIGERSNRMLEGLALSSLAHISWSTGQPEEALQFYERALPLLRDVSPHAALVAAFSGPAAVHQVTGRPAEAVRLYEQALPILRERGDRAGEATILNNLAVLYQTTGQPDAALRLYEQVLPMLQESGDRAGEGVTLNNLAGLYNAIGKVEEAHRLYEQALPLLREVEDRAGEAAILSGLGLTAQHRGNRQEALHSYEQALAILREVGDRAGEATILNNLAYLYIDSDQREKAQQFFKQALPLMREAGNRAGEAHTLNGLGLIARAKEELTEARHLFEEALKLRREAGARAGEAVTLNNLADVSLAAGNVEEALRLHEQALSLRRMVGDRPGEATTLSDIALIYHARGQYAEALQLCEDAVRIRREIQDHRGEAATLFGIGHLLQELQRYEEALTVFEQALALEQDHGTPPAEIALQISIALLLYQHMQRTPDALARVQEALARLAREHLSNDAAGHTRADVELLLQNMQAGSPVNSAEPVTPGFSPEHVSDIILHTMAAEMGALDEAVQWRERIAQSIKELQRERADRQPEIDFLSATLAVLAGQHPVLPAQHPYAQALSSIQQGIGARQTLANLNLPESVRHAIQQLVMAKEERAVRAVLELYQAELFSPIVEIWFLNRITLTSIVEEEEDVMLLVSYLDILRRCKTAGVAATFADLQVLRQQHEGRLSAYTDLITQSISALRGNAQEKMAYMRLLLALAAQTTEASYRACPAWW